jgi:Na+/proline symporter
MPDLLQTHYAGRTTMTGGAWCAVVYGIGAPVSMVLWAVGLRIADQESYSDNAGMAILAGLLWPLTNIAALLAAIGWLFAVLLPQAVTRIFAKD